jgi:multisubunit Na+/H+ antiporter MnhC subunit
MADWGGRRTFVILYAMLYALSCMTKRKYIMELISLFEDCVIYFLQYRKICFLNPKFNSTDFQSFWILMIGRLLGGVATSLLFSVFEAWLIRSHADAKVKQFLGKSFSWASYGNSVIAILAGLIANNAASSFPMAKVFEKTNLYYGGYLNPFDISLVTLVICGACAFTLWEENYGSESGGSEEDGEDKGGDKASASNNGKWYDGMQQAFTVTIRNYDILFCGIISSLFEGSMYIFVFMWTPALTGGNADVKLPFGVIFSTFMVCCMIGSSLFSIVMDHGVKVETLAVAIFGMASFAMLVIATSPSPTLAFIAMNLFEIAVGLYWPAMGTMKGGIVPESKRAAIYNLFRIPLNFIVLFSLLTDLAPSTSFTLCGVMLAVATGLQVALRKRRFMAGGLGGVKEDPLAPRSQTDELMVALKSSNDSEEGDADHMA